MPFSNELVTLEQEGDVFILTMHDGRGNRFNPAFVAALNEALDEVEAAAARGPTGLVTTAKGKIFSNGLDLEAMLGFTDSQRSTFLVSFEALLNRILVMPCVTVAAVNGHAFAGGCMAALSHDFVVMRTGRGYLATNEVDLGLPLRPGMAELLNCKLSPALRRDMCVFGKRVTAEEGSARGIVDFALPVEDVLPKAVEIASQLAAKCTTDVLSALKKTAFPFAHHALLQKAVVFRSKL